MSEQAFQPEPNTIIWKLHFRSSPETVYQALSTNEGRRKYWAESADEIGGLIHYKFFDEIEDKGKILVQDPPARFAVTYFSWNVTFDLQPDGSNGTDMVMSCKGVPEDAKNEISAGWVSWLMAMKAAVDFNIDLRNHDPKRTWFQGFADN